MSEEWLRDMVGKIELEALESMDNDGARKRLMELENRGVNGK